MDESTIADPLAALPPALTGWCVRVSRFDDLVVSISKGELAGKDIEPADEALIRHAATHLLAFIGDSPFPPARAQERETHEDVQPRVDGERLSEGQDLPRPAKGDE